MNAERISLLLDNYAAKLPEGGAALPAGAASLWEAAAQCRTAFDLSAPDLPGMLHAAFDGAASAINYAGSVQPLNGLFCLAEHEPEALRQALTALTAADGGDLAARQVRMQAFAERCNALLSAHAPGKRAFEQNLRAAIAYMAFLRPEENFLYKATEARYLADMLGFQTDVSSGAHFTLAGYYDMGELLSVMVAQHGALCALITEDGPLPPEAQRRLLVYDILLNAGPKKLALFGDEQPLIRTRSRVGQANQERALRISRLQLEIAQLRTQAEKIRDQIAALPTPDLQGQRFRSPAFGEAVALRTEGSILYVEAGGVQRRMALPLCFLQGYLIPEDPAIAERYAQERSHLRQQRELEKRIVDLEGQVNRLQVKP